MMRAAGRPSPLRTIVAGYDPLARSLRPNATRIEPFVHRLQGEPDNSRCFCRGICLVCHLILLTQSRGELLDCASSSLRRRLTFPHARSLRRFVGGELLARWDFACAGRGFHGVRPIWPPNLRHMESRDTLQGTESCKGVKLSVPETSPSPKPPWVIAWFGPKLPIDILLSYLTT